MEIIYIYDTCRRQVKFSTFRVLTVIIGNKVYFKEDIAMSNKLKKIAASVIAVATLAVGATGISASAYSNSASMTLRNVSGAPGNVTSGNLTINSKSGSSSYYTSYDFSSRTNATLTVSTTNAINNRSVKLTKSSRTGTLKSVQARYSYITFRGNLANSAGESGVWSVS